MRQFAWIILLASGLVWGCGGEDKDKKAPPAPRVDRIESPTGLEQVVLTGSAEPGATIEIRGAAGVEPEELTADRFDASFSALVTLAKDATNELSVVAIDKAGNESEPTALTIVQEDGHGKPAELTLELFVNDAMTAASDPITLAAGDALRAAITLTDAGGHALDLPVALSTSIPEAFVAGDEISNIHVAGSFAVAATVAGSSFATSRVVVVTPGVAAEIALDVSPASVMAGTTIQVHAVARDAFGNELPDTDIELSSEPELDAIHTPACSSKDFEQGFLDGSRFVAYDLSDAAGASYVFTLIASSGDVSASTAVTVRPGPAARFAPLDPDDCDAGELFTFTDETWSDDVDDPVDVSSGESLYYRYGVIDAYGNQTEGPVSVVTSAPGANVIDDGVSGRGQVAHLTNAGSFELTAYVAGVAAPAVRSFSVEVGDANSASIFLSSTLVSPADEVIAFATVRDAYGNTVACPSGDIDPELLDISAEPAGTALGGDTSCADGLFQRSFTFGENGTYAVTVAYDDGSPVAASAYATVLGIDATPPSVTIENLLVNGDPCTLSGTPPVCNVARGDTVEFDLVADDNIALSEVQYSAFFQTTGTLRTRNLLLAGDSVLPATVHFSFNVANGALPEDVPLVGLAIDSSGNRTTTDQLILRVGVYTTFGRTVSVAAVGGAINQPNDIAFDAAGTMFIANDGDQNLLQVASGATTPVVFSDFDRASRFVVVDGSGRIYVTDGTRISRISADGSTFDNYATIAGGSTEGLDLAAATVAKGTVDANASSDGASVTIAGQVYELDVSSNGCVGGGAVCVAAGGNKNQALAASIMANSAMVNASHETLANRVVLAAKTAGEAGNAVTLSASGMTVSGATLTEGHGEELVLGQTNDDNIYRLPETLSPTANVGASHHGSFNVGQPQLGVAWKDMTTPTMVARRDVYLYFVDDGNNDTLRGYHAVDGGAPTQVFSVSSTGGGGGGDFQSLYDVALEPVQPTPATNPTRGCVLVSDDQTGDIYAVDTRDATDTTPAVTVVASGFNEPRGLAFHAGDLYVADRGDDVIVRLSPSASTSDCF